MSEPRPSFLKPGSPLGRYYTVEARVRLAEGRVFYLVNDDRVDEPFRKCWSCGVDTTPRREERCATCGTTFESRRFLVSVRWKGAHLDEWKSFANMALEHPGLAVPIDVFFEGDQLFSVVPYEGEGLMIDEAAPLPNQRVLDIGQRVLGTLAYLREKGVHVDHLSRQNLLINRDGRVRLFDFDILAIGDNAPSEEQLLRPFQSLAEVLRSYTHVESDGLRDFLTHGLRGDYPDSSAFGRALESRFDSFALGETHLDIAGMTDVGQVRQLNEDSWGWTRLGPRATLFVVADGMGGHEGGEIASHLAVETICSVARRRAMELDDPGLDALENLLDEAFQHANNTVKDEAERRRNGMGTTLIAMLLHDSGHAFFANVGDSRAYLLRERQLHQITVDHSLVQKMVERGRISPEEARTHHLGNVLLRSVGMQRDVEIDICSVELVKGDRVMLCTDGLWGEVEDSELQEILSADRALRVAARDLIWAAHRGGGKDNITMSLVAVS